MTFLYDKTGCKVNQKGARTRIITDKHFVTIKTILQALSTPARLAPKRSG
jgi:hypothetical protein